MSVMMSEPRSTAPKRPRERYSRLICLGCRDRRIRCELPSEVDVPDPGEFHTVQTPCYRCKRLGIPCVIRQTILGRPGRKSESNTAADLRSQRTREAATRIIVEFPLRPVASSRPDAIQNAIRPAHSSDIPWTTRSHPQDHHRPSQGCSAQWDKGTLLIHTPRSAETVLVIRALDTLRRERVEDEWFRHLPAHAGHTRALDLSIRALVTACSYAQGVPKITPRHCYRALTIAVNAVRASIEQSHGGPDDDILASTALLAPFEGVVNMNGILTRPHVEGLAAILAARPGSHPVSRLARDILDFNVGESAVMACVLDAPSPFETVPRAYYAHDGTGCGGGDDDQARLKALGNELYVRIPRLVMLVRALRVRSPPPSSSRERLLEDALDLLESLLGLQDPLAEERLLRRIEISRSAGPGAASLLLGKSLRFTSVRDFEALAFYWQGRLSLLRLEWCLRDLVVCNDVQTIGTDEPGGSFHASHWPMDDEMLRLVKSILMCSEYVGTLPLRKHVRLFAHALVVVWGAIVDMRVALGHDRDVERTDPVYEFLVQRINLALEEVKSDLTAVDIDTAADMFVGGQPKGKFAELYGL